MAERARWIPLMTSATRPPTPLQSVSLHSVAPKAKKNISGQLHCNNMILSNIYKYNHVSSGPPRLPGNSLVKIAEWRGNTNNQWSTAEASERCLYLVFLGISALFHLFIFLFFIFWKSDLPSASMYSTRWLFFFSWLYVSYKEALITLVQHGTLTHFHLSKPK